MSMVPIADLNDAKRLSRSVWDNLLPSERQRTLALLGRMHGYYDELAIYTMVANGRIERLREALQLALFKEKGWEREAHATLAACPSPLTVSPATGEG